MEKRNPIRKKKGNLHGEKLFLGFPVGVGVCVWGGGVKHLHLPPSAGAHVSKVQYIYPLYNKIQVQGIFVSCCLDTLTGNIDVLDSLEHHN